MPLCSPHPPIPSEPQAEVTPLRVKKIQNETHKTKKWQAKGSTLKAYLKAS